MDEAERRNRGEVRDDISDQDDNDDDDLMIMILLRRTQVRMIIIYDDYPGDETEQDQGGQGAPGWTRQ